MTNASDATSSGIEFEVTSALLLNLWLRNEGDEVIEQHTVPEVPVH